MVNTKILLSLTDDCTDSILERKERTQIGDGQWGHKMEIHSGKV
jgi:hypothetical protein